jgi:hypothetical protein
LLLPGFKLALSTAIGWCGWVTKEPFEEINRTIGITVAQLIQVSLKQALNCR